MPCQDCSREEFTTYLRWMDENVQAALNAHVIQPDGRIDWLLNSALGLLVCSYCETLGKLTHPNANPGAERFHSFVAGHLMNDLAPTPAVAFKLAGLDVSSPFEADSHLGASVLWRIYRNGFAHSFAPATPHPIEFRWGRYPEANAWVLRERQTCIGSSNHELTPVDVVDLNVQHLGQVFSNALAAQGSKWQSDIAGGAISWGALLDRLRA